MSDLSWRQRWRWLFVPISAFALVWAVWLLRDSISALKVALPQLQSWWLAFVGLGCLLSSYFGFESFRVLFNQLCPGCYTRLQLAHLYFTGQLMKHLPGRVWSIAYQASVGQKATLSEWVGATVVHMVLTMLFAIWLSAVVLLSSGYVWFSLLVFGFGLVSYFYLWNRSLLSSIVGWMGQSSRPIFKRFSLAVTTFVAPGARFKWEVLLWFSLSWLVYFAAWAGYGLAWPGLGIVDGVWLCALYTLAWLAGYLSMLSPSGLGVRELVFVGLAHGYPPDAVAGIAVLGRVMLLLADVVMGILFVGFGKFSDE